MQSLDFGEYTGARSPEKNLSPNRQNNFVLLPVNVSSPAFTNVHKNRKDGHGIGDWKCDAD
ncbi:hypothetical protein BWQ96_04972 [Gracilariopsis chorda]|uniref:Uncharacterized protein n=1 Tax=Gracilariopsis chorda TaxID=448386 RepID=A0A2V3IT24_9FLOR|nr:hypothetical protein BWQ96_04972 [Gracilariopsis chorda]|eukprot:PXF45273.1 hypothetical protein BWQ96_04972 [Gracilariopsis chorda]